MDDHYEVLGLSDRRNDRKLTQTDVKQAYRRALLQYHPDKSVDGGGAKRLDSKGLEISVDQITVAFKTLCDPARKAEYDKIARLDQAGSNKARDVAYYTGLDTVDLDDLDYDEAARVWWKGCRCGQRRGFIVTEEDLEREIRQGELITGCRGCSLWLKVLFSAVDDEDRRAANNG